VTVFALTLLIGGILFVADRRRRAAQPQTNETDPAAEMVADIETSLSDFESFFSEENALSHDRRWVLRKPSDDLDESSLMLMRGRKLPGDLSDLEWPE
jgi:hypothetical protein